MIVMDKFTTPCEGEWIFRRILEGAGIEDVFICSSRKPDQKIPNRMVSMALLYGCLIRKRNVMTWSIRMISPWKALNLNMKMIN